MSDSRTPPTPSQSPTAGQPSDRYVYVVPEGSIGREADDAIDLFELLVVLWKGKWIVISFTLVLAIAAVVIAIVQTPWYRAEVLLAPAEQRDMPAVGGQLGGLVSLAGVSVGGGESVEAIATLRSRGLVREFIEEFDLLPVLFSEDWNVAEGRWRHPDPEEWPDIRDGVRFFLEDVLTVSEERDTGLVTMAIEWTDPELAAQWAMVLVARLNQRLRNRALQEAEANVSYLREELSQTNVVTLQQSIGRLLESELQTVMLARGNEEFAFRVIDPADIPKLPARPRRLLIAVVGTMIGGTLGVFAVFVRHKVRRGETVG